MISGKKAWHSGAMNGVLQKWRMCRDKSKKMHSNSWCFAKDIQGPWVEQDLVTRFSSWLFVLRLLHSGDLICLMFYLFRESCKNQGRKSAGKSRKSAGKGRKYPVWTLRATPFRSFSIIIHEWRKSASLLNFARMESMKVVALNMPELIRIAFFHWRDLRKHT